MATVSRTSDETPHGRLEWLLGEQNARLHAHLQALRGARWTVASGVRDLEEQAVDSMDLGVNLTVLQLDSEAVREIDTARSRLRAGTLGLCADCEAMIPKRRLRAVPFAERCRDCQQVQDAAVAQTSRTRDGGQRLDELRARGLLGMPLTGRIST